MAITLLTAGKSDLGRVRKNNEDQFLIAELTKHLRVTQSSVDSVHTGTWSGGVMGHLLVVADGMGGIAGGEVASGLAVETISWHVARTMPWFYRYQDGREKELEAELVRAVEKCDETITDAAAASQFHRMGTTLTMAYVLWPRLYVVHAGDSRCYVQRGGKLVRMTKDHTVAQQAIERGIMTEEQAKTSPFGNTLWNCIGGGVEGVRPDVYHLTLQPNDELLLCSDGLTRRLEDSDVRDILLRSATPESACDSLIAAANEAGGQDNITVIVARVQPINQNDTTPPDGIQTA